MRALSSGRAIPVVFVGLVLLVFAGCAGQSQLMPQPGDKEVPGDPESAVSTVDNVHVVLHTEAWKGRPEVASAVTPIRITIENNGNQPVRLRYTDFKLIGSKGEVYADLPPYGITGSIEQPRLVQAYPVIVTPDFEWQDFDVAPYYAEIYPDMPVWDGPFYYDPWYYNTYYTYWQEIQLPTQRMLNEALPDGVINPGGRVTGFLYFQEVTTKQKSVRFEYSLVNARTGNIFGTITIPFAVKKE
jgi:hypothetical protein